jgi:hypothetical protein
MRTTHFIPVALLVALAACNNASDKSATATDTTQAAATHDTTAHATDTTAAIAALPPVPAGAKVFFKNLKNGQTVKSPFKVEFGVEGLKVDTAGAIVAGSGHHHLLVNAEDSLAAGAVIPKDEKHMHFGKAQTSTELTLPPGKYKLTLQFADGIHRSYGSQLSSTVSVTVK